jgi:hypothetical protein
MWEVVNGYMIIHNLITESEGDAPEDDHPFDF